MSTYQPSFFDEAERLTALTKLKDPLVELKEHINFELFRPKLAEAFKPKTSGAGRKPKAQLDTLGGFGVYAP